MLNDVKVPFASPALANTPLLMIHNNEDETINVKGVFSTGQGAEGVALLVKNKLEGKVNIRERK